MSTWKSTWATLQAGFTVSQTSAELVSGGLSDTHEPQVKQQLEALPASQSEGETFTDI